MDKNEQHQELLNEKKELKEELKITKRQFDEQNRILLQETREDIRKIFEEMHELTKVVSDSEKICIECRADFQRELIPIKKKLDLEEEKGAFAKFFEGLKTPVSVVYLIALVLTLLFASLNSGSRPEREDKMTKAQTFLSNVIDKTGKFLEVTP